MNSFRSLDLSAPDCLCSPLRTSQWLRRRLHVVALVAFLLIIGAAGCEMPGDGDMNGNGNGNANQNDNGNVNSNDNGNDNSNGNSAKPVWREAFDTSQAGDLSGVWGSAPDDVYVVGGTPDVGVVYHFDGDDWSAVTIPQVSLLVWVFGFGSDNVIAVGEDGSALQFDGAMWRTLDTGVSEALWGVWGSSPDDIWIVGGDAGSGDPIILHYDGATFTPFDVPANDRDATSLFKVWGIGDKVFAVGENGLIIEFADGQWSQVAAGAAADDDFVSLWGTAEENIVAVGGRSSARISVYDGAVFDTQLFSGVPGLNAVFSVSDTEVIVGGQNGYAAVFDPSTEELTEEDSGTSTAIHATWGDGAGRVYAVGGRFSPPHAGIALVRYIEDVTTGGAAACELDSDCDAGMDCVNSVCDSPSAGATMELGYLENDQFDLIQDGGVMPLFFGFQGGGSHMFATLRVTGLSADVDIDISWEVTWPAMNRVLATADTFFAVSSATEDDNVVLVQDQFVLMNELASVLNNETLDVSFTINNRATGEVVASVMQSIVVRSNQF